MYNIVIPDPVACLGSKILGTPALVADLGFATAFLFSSIFD